MADLNIVSFNIRCFGFNGDYFARKPTESRIDFLKSFLEANFSETDIFVFQEIMDPLVLNQILPEGFKSYTYEHDYERHMFVVLACRKEYDITSFQTIAGTTIDDKRSRPAVYGQVVFNSKPILDLIGVHLKSNKDNTENRNNQCRMIAEFIDELPLKLPRVLTGDFNSHAKEKTHKAQDDLTYMQEILKEQLSLADHGKSTYLATPDSVKLDHFFTKDLEVLDINVYELPNYSGTSSFKKYYKEISDHLPVRIKIKI